MAFFYLFSHPTEAEDWGQKGEKKTKKKKKRAQKIQRESPSPQNPSRGVQPPWEITTEQATYVLVTL